MPSETMASVVNRQVLNSGRVASCLVRAFGRISTYLLRGKGFLPAAGRKPC